MSRFLYLPYLAGVMIGELSFFIWIVLRLNRKYVLSLREEGDQGLDDSLLVNSVIYSVVNQSDRENVMPTTQRLAAKQESLRGEFNIIRPVRFGDTYESYGPITMKLLLVTRLLSFLYFSLVAIWRLDVINHTWAWYFFTTWNLYLLSLFYLLAFSASCIGLCSSVANIGATNSRLGTIVHSLYEVAGSTAFLVTVVAFTLLDPQFSFQNMTIHFFTTCSVLVEMLLNKMTVLPLHIIFNFVWASTYLAFIWTVVACGAVEEWPYDFLQTDTWQCFLWYTGLFIGVMFFFSLFWAFSKAKMKCHDAYLKRQALLLEMQTADTMFSDPIESRYMDGRAFA
jgi:hypothetical protein